MLSFRQRSPLRAVILACVILLPGTPSIVSAESARDSLLTLAALETERRSDREETSGRVGGAPPDVDELRTLGQAPPLSGAYPPYPRNHVLDANPQSDLGDPPANHDFETPGYAVGTPATNYDLEAAAQEVGTPPTNHDFETGDFSGWTTSGTMTIDSDSEHGYYARLTGSNANIISDAFTVDSAAQAFLFEGGHLTTSGGATIVVHALSGPSYSTSTQLGFFSCSACNVWKTYSLDATPYRGQSIKLKFTRSSGAIGIDAVRMAILFPDVAVSGPVSRGEEAGNSYARLTGTNATLITAPFTVDSSTQYGALDATGLSTSSDQYYVYLLSGQDYSTQTQVLYQGSIPDEWRTVRFFLGPWQGQSVKLKVVRQYGSVGIDNLGIQWLDAPGWTVTADTRIEEESGNRYISTNGELYSQPFTLPAEVDHLLLEYRGGAAATSFRARLYGGPSYADELLLIHQSAPEGVWQTLRIGVAEYAGQSVVLKLERYWGRPHFDEVGVTEKVLPGWQLSGTNAFLAGEDAAGSYVTPVEHAVGLRSSIISNGITVSGSAGRRYYSATYAFGEVTGAVFRVRWHNPATGESWIVFQRASDVATEPQTGYFWVAEFMGTEGYFAVQVPKGGKFYAIADNIARVQLSEPFSEKVGQRIDTSTGSFGYQETDIRTEGILPLSFTRYYAGHSAHYGVMGFRWRHTYDTRLEITDSDDAGVIHGSGQEIFFDWNWVSATFTPADARVHDRLVKNGDGSYTYTTRTNLSYHFDAGGVLQTITDLNGNQIALSYDGQGRLETIAGLGSQVLTLGYDGNSRLSTVTDPENEIWSYTYDANGDLIKVTDPALGEREYEYDRHRLTKAINPLGDTVFENVFDDWHRVVEQKDAEGNRLTVAYDSPGQGATQVTDPEGNTATFHFDQQQRTTHMVDPLGHVITRGYDANGYLVEIIDADFNQWSFGYNASGDLTSLLNPLGQSTLFTYNNEHLPTSSTDARGYTTTFAYDGNGNLLTETDPLSNSWTYTYDAAGNRLSATDPLNNTWTYTYNTAGNKLTETDPLNNTWTYTYDNRGRVLSQTDPQGNTTIYAYDLLGYLESATDPLGNAASYAHDFWGNLHRYTDRMGNQVNWSYNALGEVESMTDEAGKIWNYTYDANHNPLTETNPLGKIASYAWDEKDRLISITDPLNNTTTFTYDANDQLLTETDPLNRTTSYSYDDAGRLTSRTMSNGGVWSYTYDANGNLLTQTDPLNNTTSYTYDANNRLITVTDARNNVTTYAYDAAGRRISMTDPLNNTTTYGYDAAGRLASITDAMNNTTTFTYDAAGRRTGKTDPLGNVWTYGYDVFGQRTSVTDPLNNTTTTSYDANGRVTQVVRPTGATMAYTYDPRGLLLTITDPLNNPTTYAYDAAGRRVSLTDRRNNTTSYGYDDAGRMATMTDALGGVVSFGYDAAGQLTSLTNPSNQTTSYTYDQLGKLLTHSDPLNRTTTYTYNLAGQRTSMTDPRGISVSYSYDANGNRISTAYPGGSISEAYDANNRRTSMTDVTGQTIWSYDALGQITSVAAPSGTVNYTYDATGRRATLGLSGGRTYAYAYDAAGRTSSITDWLSQTISFGYDADSRRTSNTRPNGVTSTYAYDAADQVTSIDHSGIGCQCTLQSYTYTYDAEGNRTSMTTAAGTESYALDALNRLTAVTYANGDTEAFTYDAGGNRLTATFNGNPVATYSYDAAGQLISDGTNSYSHDAAGNLTAAGADGFSWDWANQLTSATVGGVTETYVYDGDGTRTSSTTGGATTSYLWDRLGPVEYLVDDGSRAYLHDQGLLSETDGNNVTTYPLADGLGSIRGLTDPSEILIGTSTYSAFGAVRSQSGASSLFGFTGEQSDGVTDNLYLRARYFAPGLGRFLSTDSMQPNAPGTQGYNLYAYVANNPTTWVDPTGHSPAAAIAAFLASLGVGGLAVLTLFIILVFYIIYLCLAQIICDVPEAAAPGNARPSITPPTASRPCIGAACFGIIIWDLVTTPFIADPTIHLDFESDSSEGGGTISPPADWDWPSNPSRWDPTVPPYPGWEWRPKDSIPGIDPGGWVSPDGNESLHPDLDHPLPIGPHWDWNKKDRRPKTIRLFPDGRAEPR